jgi:hypothetical protein
MTTMPLEVRVLKPGATEAQETLDANGQSIGKGTDQMSRLPEVEFYPIEYPPGQQPQVVAAHADTLGSAAHDQIQIGSLLDNRLRMREPLTLVLEQQGEFYIAKCEELNEFGYGIDPISAVQDMRNTIAELYWQLKENQERLGSDLANTWQRLSSLVYEA